MQVITHKGISTGKTWLLQNVLDKILGVSWCLWIFEATSWFPARAANPEIFHR